MLKRKYTTSEKVKHMVSSYNTGGTSVTEYCRKHSIPRSNIYRWRKSFESFFDPKAMKLYEAVISLAKAAYQKQGHKTKARHRKFRCSYKQ